MKRRPHASALKNREKVGTKNNMRDENGLRQKTNRLEEQHSLDADDHKSNEPDDVPNYILLIALYTLQGIPMGLTASIPFLIQQKIKTLAELVATGASITTDAEVITNAAAVGSDAVASKLYNAQAIFALCSWPFSLKLLWAPIVDSIYFKRIGRRKSWLIPIQTMAGALMLFGSGWVDSQLESNNLSDFDVKGITIFFFCLYFLMATQDIAVDGWALTMLSKENRGRGPLCNSIGQNIGYFLSYVGFLALNDAETSDKVWRPLLGIKNREGNGEGLVSLGAFLRAMGCVMLAVTAFVAVFKREVDDISSSNDGVKSDDEELDAAKIGLVETYRRLWHVCQLPAVKTMFLILLTYRFPTSLSDNVKTLKAVEFGLSKQTISLLSPIVILPIGILVPIIGSKIFHGHPLRQFMTAYKARVTLVALFDVGMLMAIRTFKDRYDFRASSIFWFTIVGSTALQAIVAALQFNAQMTFFASRVDPAIGGSYMTLLNTMANLGGTWPASAVMYLVGKFTKSGICTIENGVKVCSGGRDAYFPLQLFLSSLGVTWILLLGRKVRHVAELPESAWRTTVDAIDDENCADSALESGKRSKKKS